MSDSKNLAHQMVGKPGNSDMEEAFFFEALTVQKACEKDGSSISLHKVK